MSPTTRLVEVRRHILKNNDLVARDLRARCHKAASFRSAWYRAPARERRCSWKKSWIGCAMTIA
jgi:hypothetical protein